MYVFACLGSTINMSTSGPPRVATGMIAAPVPYTCTCREKGGPLPEGDGSWSRPVRVLVCKHDMSLVEWEPEAVNWSRFSFSSSYFFGCSLNCTFAGGRFKVARLIFYVHAQYCLLFTLFSLLYYSRKFSFLKPFTIACTIFHYSVFAFCFLTL